MAQEPRELKLWNQFASSLIRTSEAWYALQAYARKRGGPDYLCEEVQKKLARCSWRSVFHKMVGRLVDYAMTTGGLGKLLIIKGKE